jgi:hypothetical protein
LYAALTAPLTAHVLAQPVYDAAEPPKVISARFVDELNGLSVRFDKPTDRAGRAGSFSCSALLTAASLDELFGRGSGCKFASPSELHVTFGAGATVVPGQPLQLAAATRLRAAARPASLFATSSGAPFAVLPPARPTAPLAELAVSAQRLGVCDGLVLDASGSSGGGGRDLSLVWSAAVAADSGAGAAATGGSGDGGGGAEAGVPAAVSAALAAASAARSGRGADLAVLPVGAMQPGTRLTFTVEATNFIGARAISRVTVAQLAGAAPALSVAGSDPVTGATRTGGWTLVAAAALPDVGCLLGSTLADAAMAYAWTETTGRYNGPLVGTSKDPHALVIPAGALDAGVNYTFQVYPMAEVVPAFQGRRFGLKRRSSNCDNALVFGLNT